MKPNSKQKTIYNEGVVSDLLQIIDAKIKYVAYELDAFLKAQFKVVTEITDELIQQELSQLDWANATESNFLILDKIEATSRKKALLLILKQKTIASTTNRIWTLLDKDHFLTYSPQQLQHLLSKRPKATTISMATSNYAKQVA